MPHRRPAPLTRLACCALVLLAACQQPKQPEVDVEVLHTEPPASVTSNCPALPSDWLAALPTQSRRIEPAHCSSHVGTPLFAWGHAADRLAGSPYQLTVRPVGGAAVQNLAGLTEPRARLTAALSAGEYEWAVIHAGASGVQQSTQWRRFTVTASDGQVRAQDLVDGTQLAAQVAARARPRSFTTGSSAESLRTFAQQPEHLPALTLLRARANAATSAAVTATAPGLDTSSALARAQSLATLVQGARSERQSVEALSLLAKLDANANFLAAAKRRLLALAGWPSNGSSGEASSSAANAETSLALAQGLDLLWNDLSAAERSQVSVALRDRLQQAANGWAQLDREPFAQAIQPNLRLHLQALLLAAGAFPEAQTLLARAWELHRHQLYLWGFDGNHGSAVAQSWQQFAAQATAAAAVRVVAGVNLYDLSVIRRSAEPLLALTAPGAALAAPFGDEAETRNLYDRHSAALRLHAQQSRDLASIWYWQAKATNVSSPQDASIWQLLLLGVSRQDLPVGSTTVANDWYSPQAGLAALHTDIRRADRSSVFFRSSRHGAYGAAQAEQNAIVFVSQGQSLLVSAGTTPFAGSAHHRHTRASRYKNTLSVDGGFGQAESAVGAARPTDPLFNMDAAGSLTRTQSAGAYAAVTGDATAAYRAVDPARNVWVPLLSNAVRSVVMDKANGLVFVYDWATSSQARQWELNWHSPNPFNADASTVRATNGVASVCLDRHGPATQFSQTQAWTVAPEIAAPAPASARFSTLSRSLEFAHLTVLRESCRTVPLQVTQNGAQITVLVNGRDTLQFDRRALSLPSGLVASSPVNVTTTSSSPAASAGSGTTGAGSGLTGEAAAIAALEQQPLRNVMSVSRSDIGAQLNADASSQTDTGWSGINCYGQYGNWTRFQPDGIRGTKLPDGDTLRFGLVTDPLNPQRKVFALRVHKDDVLTSGAKRCEVLAPGAGSTALPVGKDFWYAFSIRIVEGAITSGDDQLLSQWHVYGVPIFSLLVKDGRLRIENRFNANAALSAGTTTLVTPWRDSVPATNRWMHFVVKARISAFEKDAPYITVWRNGTLLFDRKGPIGLNSTALPFAKLGFYHWINQNTWDAKVPVRTIHLNQAVTVLDPGNRYNEATLRAMVL